MEMGSSCVLLTLPSTFHIQLGTTAYWFYHPNVSYIHALFSISVPKNIVLVLGYSTQSILLDSKITNTIDVKVGKDPRDHSSDGRIEDQKDKCLTQDPTIQPSHAMSLIFL